MIFHKILWWEWDWMRQKFWTVILDPSGSDSKWLDQTLEASLPGADANSAGIIAEPGSTLSVGCRAAVGDRKWRVPRFDSLWFLHYEGSPLIRSNSFFQMVWYVIIVLQRIIWIMFTHTISLYIYIHVYIYIYIWNTYIYIYVYIYPHFHSHALNISLFFVRPKRIDGMASLFFAGEKRLPWWSTGDGFYWDFMVIFMGKSPSHQA